MKATLATDAPPAARYLTDPPAPPFSMDPAGLSTAAVQDASSQLSLASAAAFLGSHPEYAGASGALILVIVCCLIGCCTWRWFSDSANRGQPQPMGRAKGGGGAGRGRRAYSGLPPAGEEYYDDDDDEYDDEEGDGRAGGGAVRVVRMTKNPKGGRR